MHDKVLQGYALCTQGKAITLGLFGWEVKQNETVNFTIGSGVELSIA